jgi:hypothetical protein
MDPLIRRVLAAVRPPAEMDWSDNSWGEIYELLYGSAIALCSSRFSIERRLSDPLFSEYTQVRKQLYDSLEIACASTPADIGWQREAFALWSSGFFLNKAQINVIAAVDRSINLIARRLIRGFDRHFLHTWIVARAAILEVMLENTPHRDLQRLARSLAGGLDSWPAADPEQQRYEIVSAAMAVRNCGTLIEISTEVDKRYDNSAAIVHGIHERFNWFKHHPDGLYGRDGGEADNTTRRVGCVEWALTLLALEWASTFWRESARAFGQSVYPLAPAVTLPENALTLRDTPAPSALPKV